MFFSLFHQPSHCQQPYLYNLCTSTNISEGYLCGESSDPCRSFVSFRSRKPYRTATSIAVLLGSEAYEVATLNNLSPDAIIPNDQLIIIVPISCSCQNKFFNNFGIYENKLRFSNHYIASYVFQGLTTCEAIENQNDNEMEIMVVPVRCACPSDEQRENGVHALLTHGIDLREPFEYLGEKFAVSSQTILEANMLSSQDDITTVTPLLVPLKNESCSMNPKTFYCKSCLNGNLLAGPNCISDHGKSFPAKLVTLVAVSLAFGLLCVLLATYKLYQCLKKRRIKVRKEVLFKQNGGHLLLQKLSPNGSNEKAKLFTAEELQKATDNYNQSRFLGKGGYGTVYKGMLPDGTIAAVKKSIAIGRNQIEQFINEVVILSQINHRNIVKLLGCCLETEKPLLVYEFISNGTLSDHLQTKDPESSLSWETRLSIACDVAGALAYMHSAASMPIFHRDVKSSNILLDHKYNAKIADFGTSRSVPQDKTHLTTAVQGTLGYMDPEYFQSNQFTDKSDVYSYGVTLMELLTGENPYSFAKDEGKNLVETFSKLTQENQVVQILDGRVAAEAREEDIQAIAELATRCLRLNGKKRPTMKQVTMELEGLRKNQTVLEMDQQPQFSGDEVQEQVDCIDISEEIEYVSVALTNRSQAASTIVPMTPTLRSWAKPTDLLQAAPMDRSHTALMDWSRASPTD
ncbi:hypothetical protein UlMin_045132 [Ulmus minor]